MSKYDAPPQYPQAPPQAHYDAGPVDTRGTNGDFYNQHQGQYGQYPPQQGQYPPQQYPPMQGGYQQYPQGQQMNYGPPQSGMYPPRHQDRGSGAGGCCAGIMAALACCCCLDCLF